MLIQVRAEKSRILFPQANDIYKVIKFVDNNYKQKYEYFLRNINLQVSPRQIDYYKNAAVFLGFYDRNGITDYGKTVFQLEKNDMLVLLVKNILENYIFSDYFKNRKIKNVIDYLIEHYNYNQVTSQRRANTVKSWIKWCDIIISDFNLQIEFY